jgi:homoserine O-acetyltransferase/O-succinyltransferase
VGDRRFVPVGGLDLELGGRLDAVTVAYETWGELAPDRSNAVLVLHALTGDAHVVGPSGPGQPTPGWWDGLVGADAPLDPASWYVVAPNVLGGCQGTTGPASLAPDGRPYGSRFPRITIADQVAVERALADALGITRWAAVIGGSMGGMRALEWAVATPERVGSLLFLASGSVATADQIATQSIQVRAVTSDPRWNGGDFHDAPAGQGPTEGLGLARRIAHLTYRTELELDTRFGATPQPGEDPLAEGRYAVESYLDHQAAKLAHRFDAGSYVALTDAMTTWDVGRGRAGIDAALARVTMPTIVAGIDSDRLYPLRTQREVAERVPGLVGDLRVIRSLVGHDGFLVERDAVFALVTEVLDLVPAADDEADDEADDDLDQAAS